MAESDNSLLAEWFQNPRGSYPENPRGGYPGGFVDVIIAGRIFGGRHGESMQIPRKYEFDGEILRIFFKTTEVLTVHNPSGFELGEYEQLIVPHASKAIFGWHYYGRRRTPDNWCEQIYEIRGSTVRLTCTGPLLPGTEKFQYSGDRFVELR